MAKDEDLDDYENEDWDDDDLGLDDEFGDEFGGFNPSQDTSDRNPVTTAAGSAIDGFRDSLTDFESIRELFEEKLPSDYKYAYNDTVKAYNAVDRNIGKITRTARDEGRKLRRSLGHIAPLAEEYLGTNIGQKIKKWSGIEDSKGSSSTVDPEQAFVASAINEAMGTIAQQQTEQNNQQQALDLIRTTKEESRAKTNFSLLSSIDKNTSITTGYLNKIDLGFKRKQLEFQARSFLLQQRQFELSRGYVESSLRHFEAIVKNTGLPNEVKLRNMEMAKNMAASGLIAAARTKAGDFASGYLGQMKDNLDKWVDEKIRDVRDNVETVTDLLSQFGEMHEVMKEMEGGFGDDTERAQAATTNKARIAELLASQLGRLGVTLPAEKLATKMEEFLESNPEAIRKGKDIAYWQRNLHMILPQVVEQFESSEGEGWSASVKRNFAKALRVIMPTLGNERETPLVTDMLKGSSITSLGRTVSGDIIQESVIPGWLQRIEYNTRVAAFGASGQSMLAFDPTNQTFKSMSSAASAIKKFISPSSERESARKSVENLIETMGIGDKLSPDELITLSRNLAKAAYEQGDTSNDLVNLFVRGKVFEGISNADELRDHMRDKWGVGDDVDDNDISAFKAGSIDTANLRSKIEKDYRNLINLSDAGIERLRNVQQLGIGNELLVAAGILSEEDGELKYNYDRRFREATGTDDDLEVQSDDLAINPPKLSRRLQRQLSQRELSLNVNPKKPLSINFADKAERFLKEQVSSLAEQVRTAKIESAERDPDSVNKLGGIESRLDTIIDLLTVGQDYQHVLEELVDEANQLSADNGEVLAGILDTVENLSINYYNINSESIISKGKSWVGKQWRKVKSLPGNTLGFIKGKLKGLIKSPARAARYAYLKTKRQVRQVGGWLANKMSNIPLINKVPQWLRSAKERALSGADWLSARKDGIVNRVKNVKNLFLDIYVKGEGTPRITGTELARHVYTDVDTEKRVRCLTDITGPVLSPDGQFIITEDDLYIGLETRLFGKVRERLGGTLGWVRKKGAAFGKLIASASNLARNGIIGIGKFLIRKIISAAGFVKDKVKGLFTKANFACDVYVAGEAVPRLYKVKLEQGRYFNKETGLPVHGVLDLTADIEDEDGNIVLAKADILRGLFTTMGGVITKLNPFKNGNLLSKAKDFATGVIKAPFKIMGYTLATLKNLFTSGLLKTLFLTLPDNVALKANVVNILTEQLKSGKDKAEVEGDLDGDGLREGSYRDIIKDRAEAAKIRALSAKDKLAQWWNKRKEAKADKRHDQTTDKMDRIIKLLIKSNDLTEEGNGSILDSVGDAWDSFTGGDEEGSGRRRRNRGRRGGKWSRFKNFVKRTATKVRGGGFLNGLKSFGSRVAGYATRAVGAMTSAPSLLATAGRFVLGAATTLGTGLAAVVSSPWVLGAMATAAVGYAGYKVYKHFSDKYEGLERLRYMQYDSTTTDMEYVHAIREFESRVGQYVAAEKETIGWKVSPRIIYKETCDIFNLAPDNIEEFELVWNEWFINRFSPFYFAWLNAAATFKTHLGEMNTLLTSGKLDEVLHLVNIGVSNNNDPYQEQSTPFPIPFTLSTTREDVQAYINLLLTSYPNGKVDKSKDLPVTSITPTVNSITHKQTTNPYTLAAKAALNDKSSPSKPNTTSAFTKMALATQATITSNRELKKALNRTPIEPIKRDGEKEEPLSSIDSVRFYQYGVDGTDPLQVRNVRQLERYLASEVKVSKNGKIEELPDINLVTNLFSDKFGAVDNKSKEAFKLWYEYRFLPVYMKLIRRIKMTDGVTFDNYDTKLTDGEARIQFIYDSLVNRMDTKDGTVPFTLPSNPFGKATPLNTNINELAAYTSATVDKVQMKFGIKQDKEDAIKLAKMNEYLNEARNRGELFIDGAPIVSQYGVEKQAATNVIGDKSSPAYNKFQASLGGHSSLLQHKYQSTGGKIAPHQLTDKVERRISKFDQIIADMSEKYGVDQYLIRSVIRQESKGDPNARSPVGAQGLMQIMPGTAKDLGVMNAWDPAQNIEGGVKYLSRILNRVGGNVQLALAGYNAGPGYAYRAYDKWKANPSLDPIAILRDPRHTGSSKSTRGRSPAAIRETDTYMRKITADYRRRTNQESTANIATTVDVNDSSVTEPMVAPTSSAITPVPENISPTLPAINPKPVVTLDPSQAALLSDKPTQRQPSVITTPQVNVNQEWDAATAQYRKEHLEKLNTIIDLVQVATNKEPVIKRKTSLLDTDGIIDNRRPVF